jgi:hypothetical protein
MYIYRTNYSVQTYLDLDSNKLKKKKPYNVNNDWILDDADAGILLNSK